jgi:hypothetical protein
MRVEIARMGWDRRRRSRADSGLNMARTDLAGPLAGFLASEVRGGSLIVVIQLCSRV